VVIGKLKRALVESKKENPVGKKLQNAKIRSGHV
jgi:hypothetical protein